MRSKPVARRLAQGKAKENGGEKSDLTAEGSSGEEDCDVTTQSSEDEEEDEEEELMEEMTRGPSIESSESADDLSVRRQTPQDLSLGKEKVRNEKEFIDGKDESERNVVRVSENSVSTTSPLDDSPKIRESEGKRGKESPSLSRSENSLAPADLNQRHLNSANVTPSGRLESNFYRNSDDVDSPAKVRSGSDRPNQSKVHRGVPKELKLRESGRGVWARETIPKGTRYGPFLGKWVADPVDDRFAWEVRVPGSNMKGYLDGTLESSNWMKFIRSTTGKEQNLKHLLITGQIYYETIQDVRETDELLLGPRQPLQLDIFGDATNADEREAETASQHSGTLEDNREDIEDEENETRCTICNKVYPDIEQLDDHLVRTHRYPYEHFKCDRCPRAFSWRPGLLRHQTIRHGAVRKYPCENCNKIFTDPSNLQRHIRTHHVGARSHACAECGKTFATSSGLKQHTHIHSSVKPFQCEVCLKAYTQFSNLCRHRRMHADCRLQIKCGKCGQSFSSVTSQTKHKRFCDSTSSPATGATALPISQSSPTINMQGTTPSNPLFLYPRPHLPFYPSSLLGSYPPLFPSNNAHVTSPFLNSPVLFPPAQNPKNEEVSHKMLDNISSEYHHKVHNHKKRSYSNENDNATSPIDRKRRLINNTNQEKDSRTTPPPPPASAIFKSKVSPTVAEEAVSVEKPSPARPPVGGVTSTYSDPRELLSPTNKDTKVKEEVGSTKLSDFSPTTTEPNKEQPLDLRVTRKRIVYPSDEEDARDEKTPPPPPPEISSPSEIKENKTSPKGTESPVQKDEINDHSESKTKSKPHRSSPDNESSPTSRSDSNPPTMAYPRPIHPMLLEAMYRPSGFPQTFPHVNDRLLGPPPPPPPPPFGPPRTFPFLGSLMNGLPNGQTHQRSLDLLRSPLSGFAGVKPYTDVLNSHLGNGGSAKMKDRYGCKYCGKIFPRSANLTRHVRTHTGEQPYKCQYCERPFSISSNLQRHVRNIHNKEKPFKCPSCERCFGQQTNLDRHLKKHEADDGSGNTTVADSPESAESEREDACFDEIRMFMGKVTYSGDSTPQMYSNHSYSSPRLGQEADPVKEDEDSETLSEERSPTPAYSDERLTSPKDYPLPLTYDVKVKAEQESLNNNTPDQEPIEVAT